MLFRSIRTYSGGFLHNCAGRKSFEFCLQTRKLSAQEAMAALKPFYFSVHPDLFVQYPEIRNANENSLKILNGYLRGIAEVGFGGPPIRLTFYLRPFPAAEPSTSRNESDSTKKLDRTGFRVVNLDLASSDLHTTVVDILKSCSLPTGALAPPFSADKPHVINNLPPDWTEHDEQQIRMFWRKKVVDLKKRQGKQKSLKFWMEKLGPEADRARESYEAVKKVTDDIVTDICGRSGLEEITWNSDWSLTHSRACLTALKKILDSDSVNTDRSLISWGISGRKIKFASSGTWVSLNGDLILGTEDVPETWLGLLRTVRGTIRPRASLRDVERMKKNLSALLGGAEICGQPGTSMAGFKQWVGKLTDSLTTSDLKIRNMVTDGVVVMVQSDSGSLLLAESGAIHVPANCPPKKLVVFLKETVPIAKCLRIDYEKQKEMTGILKEEMIEKFELNSLRDHSQIT